MAKIKEFVVKTYGKAVSLQQNLLMWQLYHEDERKEHGKPQKC